jgi:hypothetical protein
MSKVNFSGRQLKEPAGGKHRKGLPVARIWQMAIGGAAVFIAVVFVFTMFLSGGFSGLNTDRQTGDMRAFQPPAPVDDEIQPPMGTEPESEQAWIDNIRALSTKERAEAAERQRQEDEALRQQQLAAAAQAKLTVSSGSGTPIEGNAFLVGDQSQAKAIDIYLTEVDSPFTGYGRAFISAGRTYGVDPFLVVSIAGKESSWGKHCFLPYNAWGWGESSFKNWEDAIFNYTRMLSEEYIRKGRTTPDVIGPIYCPPNYSEWAHDVNQFYAELAGVYAAIQR